MKTYPFLQLKPSPSGNSRETRLRFSTWERTAVRGCHVAIAKEHSGFVSEVVFVTWDNAGSIILTTFPRKAKLPSAATAHRYQCRGHPPDDGLRNRHVSNRT